MSDVISLSELSDEPGEANMFGFDFSPRLKAVLERLPRNSTGTATRVRHGLMDVGIFTLAALVAADRQALGRKHLGRTSIATIDAALRHFGLHRVDENPPVVVRDGASAAEAHLERLTRWIEQRMKRLEEYEREARGHINSTLEERQVLTDVMLILDGREPTNKRRRS